MKKNPSISINIPAFNEEKNLENIIRSITSQSKKGFNISEIVVFSDGSTDNTINIIKTLQKENPIIKYFAGKERQGKIFRLNQMFKRCKSDILVVFDADIGLVGNKCLENLVSVILFDKKAMMVASHQIPLRPNSFIGKIIHTNFQIWDNIRLNIPNFDSVHNFYGAATAFRGSYAKKISIPNGITSLRTYLFLLARNNDGFRYNPKSQIIYRTTETIKDYLALGNRPFGRKDKYLEDIFGNKTKNLYLIPIKYIFIGLIKSLYHQPIYTFLAILLSLYQKNISNNHQASNKAFWDISSSSKDPIIITTNNKNKPTIIFSSYDDLKNPYYAGGGAIAIHEIAKRLSKHFNIRVITGKYLGCKNETIDNVFYQRIGVKKMGPKSGQILFHLLLPFYFIKYKSDIWIESFTPPFSTLFLPLISRRPIIGLVHMLTAEDMENKYHLPFGIIERLGIKQHKRIIVLNRETSNRIKKINSFIKTYIIPNGVNLPTSKNNHNKTHILFIGRIDIRQKGLDLLIDAYLKICKKIKYPLFIAGSGIEKEEKELKRLIKQNKITNKIKLLGNIQGQAKERLFNKAAFIVIPSRYEAFSLVALESMAHNRTIINFDIEGLRWIPGDCCIRIEPFNTDLLSKSILDLSLNPKIANKIGATGYKYVKKYTWDNITKKYKKFLDEIIKKQHG
jgi:phosphatidyl-myo-inositol alpha-mannosyltransferase